MWQHMQGVVGALLHFTANLLENLPVCTLFIRLFIVLRTVFFLFLCARVYYGAGLIQFVQRNSVPGTQRCLKKLLLLLLLLLLLHWKQLKICQDLTDYGHEFGVQFVGRICIYRPVFADAAANNCVRDGRAKDQTCHAADVRHGGVSVFSSPALFIPCVYRRRRY